MLIAGSAIVARANSINVCTASLARSLNCLASKQPCSANCNSSGSTYMCVPGRVRNSLARSGFGADWPTLARCGHACPIGCAHLLHFGEHFWWAPAALCVPLIALMCQLHVRNWAHCASCARRVHSGPPIGSACKCHPRPTGARYTAMDWARITAIHSVCFTCSHSALWSTVSN